MIFILLHISLLRCWCVSEMLFLYGLLSLTLSYNLLVSNSLCLNVKMLNVKVIMVSEMMRHCAGSVHNSIRAQLHVHRCKVSVQAYATASNSTYCCCCIIHPSIHVYLHQETNHITQARQKSRTEWSMNDAHNCPKNLTKIHIQIT